MPARTRARARDSYGRPPARAAGARRGPILGLILYIIRYIIILYHQYTIHITIMSSQELAEAVSDFRRDGFGGWPWPRDDHVLPRARGRFALAGGVEAAPPPPAAPGAGSGACSA